MAAACSGAAMVIKDPMLTNASGQSPLDLLIMFINYGNISLTSNLLKVNIIVEFHSEASEIQKIFLSKWISLKD